MTFISLIYSKGFLSLFNSKFVFTLWFEDSFFDRLGVLFLFLPKLLQFHYCCFKLLFGCLSLLLNKVSLGETAYESVFWFLEFTLTLEPLDLLVLKFLIEFE